MSNILQVRNSPHGQLEIESSNAGMAGRRHLAPDSVVQVIRWRPPMEFAHDVPADYALEMVASTDAEGNQRIAPLHGYEILIVQAYLGGLAVLKNHMKLSAEEVFSYRARWLAFRWLNARGAKLRRSFSSTADLTVKRSALEAVGKSHILPDDLGINAAGQGRQWSVDDLLLHGQEAARAAGVDHPSELETIAHGLTAAAMNNPLHLNADEVLPLVRIALYAAPEEQAPSIEIREEIISRLCQAWEEHQDDPQPIFDRWCWGPHSNFAKSIANRRTGQFDKLPQADVKRVLLDLGWEAYRTNSNCLRASLRWLEHCLVDDLTPYARGLFEQTYLPQAAFGDLPLVLLMDRASIIKPLVLRLWETPDDKQLVGAFHRVLHFYQQMVETRRAADRQSKRFMAGLKNNQQKTSTVGAVDAEPSAMESKSTTAAAVAIENLARQIAERDGVRCAKCDGQLSFQIDDDDIVPGEAIECAGACPHHSGQVRHVEITWDQAIAVIATLDGENPVSQRKRQRPR